MFNEIISDIKTKVETYAKECGRKPEEIKILAVSKTHPAEIVKQSLLDGIENIAENKVQEAELKIPLLNGLYKEFHYIGHLQSNKINKLLKLNPDLIHSIDKISTAEKLNTACQAINRVQNILIEVNTSGEESKNGIDPILLEDFFVKISKLENLKIKGLMTIGTLTEDVNEIRRCFRQLKYLFDIHKLRNFENISLEYLSMGMSNDYKIAIEEGSNIIRLGSIIYGNRNYNK